MTPKELAEKYNLSIFTVYSRLHSGWTPEDFERGHKKYKKSERISLLERNTPEYHKYNNTLTLCKKNHIPLSSVLESFSNFKEFLKSIGWHKGMILQIRDHSKPYGIDNIIILNNETDPYVLSLAERCNLKPWRVRQLLRSGWGEADFEKGTKAYNKCPRIEGYSIERLCKEFNLKRMTVYARLRNGWTLENFKSGVRIKYNTDPFYKFYLHTVNYYKHRNLPIHSEWENDFESFKSFLISIGWSKGKKLFRVDSTKPLSPDNWSFRKSSRKCHLIFGMTPKEVREKFNVSRQVVSDRLKRGWTLEDFERGGRKKNKIPFHVKFFMEKFNLSLEEVTAKIADGWRRQDFEAGRKLERHPHSGKFKESRALAEKYNIPVETVRSRLRYGWTLEDFEKGYRKRCRKTE